MKLTIEMQMDTPAFTRASNNLEVARILINLAQIFMMGQPLVEGDHDILKDIQDLRIGYYEVEDI
jgi:hypothetical protein